MVVRSGAVRSKLWVSPSVTRKAVRKGVPTTDIFTNCFSITAQGIRQSTIRHLSLRNNRIPSLGGVSLAVMIKDYPDLSASPFSPSATSPSATTTYTPYTPRSRRKLDEGPLPDIPVVASNSTGGITSRHIPSSYVRPGMSDSSGDSDDEDDLPPVPVTKEEKMERNLMQTRVRSLDDVQRLGRLVTLDLKGNDLRVRFFLSLTPRAVRSGADMPS